MRALLAFAVMCAAVALDPAHAAQPKQLNLGPSYRVALGAARFSDDEQIFKKPAGKKWPDQDKLIADAMKNLRLTKAPGKTDEETVLAAIANPKTKAPLNVPASWLLDAAANAKSYKEAVPYLKAAEAELERRLKAAEPAGEKALPVVNSMLSDMAQLNVPAADRPAFDKLTRDRQFEKLSGLISAKDAKKRTAAERQFLDQLTPYQVFMELRRGRSGAVASLKYAESKQ